MKKRGIVTLLIISVFLISIAGMVNAAENYGAEDYVELFRCKEITEEVDVHYYLGTVDFPCVTVQDREYERDTSLGYIFREVPSGIMPLPQSLKRKGGGTSGAVIGYTYACADKSCLPSSPTSSLLQGCSKVSMQNEDNNYYYDNAIGIVVKGPDVPWADRPCQDDVTWLGYSLDALPVTTSGTPPEDVIATSEPSSPGLSGLKQALSGTPQQAVAEAHLAPTPAEIPSATNTEEEFDPESCIDDGRDPKLYIKDFDPENWEPTQDIDKQNVAQLKDRILKAEIVIQSIICKNKCLREEVGGEEGEFVKANCASDINTGRSGDGLPNSGTGCTGRDCGDETTGTTEESDDQLESTSEGDSRSSACLPGWTPPRCMPGKELVAINGDDIVYDPKGCVEPGTTECKEIVQSSGTAPDYGAFSGGIPIGGFFWGITGRVITLLRG
ncbi:MAG: hypothetical protein V1914_03180 [archaeon]